MSDDIGLTFEGLPQFDAAMQELAGPGFDRCLAQSLGGLGQDHTGGNY